MQLETLANYIGGTWLAAASRRALPVENPATGVVLAQVPLSGEADVDRAVTVAQQAFTTWRRVPAVQRARLLCRFRELLEERLEDLARTITLEHGKTLDEARGEVRRAIETVEHACGAPSLMMGERLEDVAAGVDCETVRQPVGVFAAITPFDLPLLVPLWFWPYAVATGNCFIVKPSERVPLTARLLFELADEAGFPAGVVNLVHGDRETAAALVRHPGVAGVSLVGATATARAVYRLAAEHGKRVQALGGARNHLVVLPDAELDRTVPALLDSAFGCAGQRCLAGSVVIAVGGVEAELIRRLVAGARRIVVGDGLDPAVTMGPVVSGGALDRVCTLIHQAEAAGARVLLDGRRIEVKGKGRGHFLGPTILGDVPAGAALAGGEVYGPVLEVRRAADLDDALGQLEASPSAGASAIFTSSGRAAREFRYAAGVSMIGVNVGVPAPMAFFPSGGTKGSFFGDLKAHGRDAIGFYTDARVVVSRWF
jgi:malonate-semialdehyde dehydrogenase (acetylating) / methylmalonate-semialdehyde dehydrogenase